MHSRVSSRTEEEEEEEEEERASGRRMTCVGSLASLSQTEAGEKSVCIKEEGGEEGEEGGEQATRERRACVV